MRNDQDRARVQLTDEEDVQVRSLDKLINVYELIFLHTGL